MIDSIQHHHLPLRLFFFPFPDTFELGLFLVLYSGLHLWKICMNSPILHQPSYLYYLPCNISVLSHCWWHIIACPSLAMWLGLANRIRQDTEPKWPCLFLLVLLDVSLYHKTNEQAWGRLLVPWKEWGTCGVELPVECSLDQLSAYG